MLSGFVGTTTTDLPDEGESAPDSGAIEFISTLLDNFISLELLVWGFLRFFLVEISSASNSYDSYLTFKNYIENFISGVLSAGDIVGIVFGVIAGTALLTVVGVLLIYKLRLIIVIDWNSPS